MCIFHNFTILLYDIIGFIKRERERERERERASIPKNSLFSLFTRFAEMVIDIYTGMIEWFTLFDKSFSEAA